MRKKICGAVLGFFLCSNAFSNVGFTYDLRRPLNEFEQQKLASHLSTVLNVMQRCAREKNAHVDYGVRLQSFSLSTGEHENYYSLVAEGQHPAPSFAKYTVLNTAKVRFHPQPNPPMDAPTPTTVECHSSVTYDK